jgi:hypothetical protein
MSVLSCPLLFHLSHCTAFFIHHAYSAKLHCPPLCFTSDSPYMPAPSHPSPDWESLLTLFCLYGRGHTIWRFQAILGRFGHHCQSMAPERSRNEITIFSSRWRICQRYAMLLFNVISGSWLNLLLLVLCRLFNDALCCCMTCLFLW